MSLSNHELRRNQTLTCCVNPLEYCSNPASGFPASPSALHYEALILTATLHTRGGEETDEQQETRSLAQSPQQTLQLLWVDDADS